MNDHLSLSLSQRTMRGERLREKHPNMLPVIVSNFKDMPKLDKEKYLVPKDLLLGQLISIVKHRLKIKPSEGIMVYVNDCILPTCSTMSVIFDAHASPEGFLYLKYSKENVFG